MMRVQSMGNRAMNMIGIFFAVFTRLLRMRWVLSVSLWAWLEPVFYCFMRMRRVPNVSKNQRMIGTGKKKKFSSHEDEESSKCEQEPKDDWNVLTILSHLMRMRRVPSVSLRAWLESVFNCFSHSRGWGKFWVWVCAHVWNCNFNIFSHFMRMRKFRVGAYKHDWTGYLLFFSFHEDEEIPSGNI